MAHCKYCGNYVESSDRECPSCGARIDHPEEDTVENTVDLEDTADAIHQITEDIESDTRSLRHTSDVKSYMVPSIICTVLFLSPFCLAAFIFGILVKVRTKSGDEDGAIKASRWARILMWAGIIVGILMYSFGTRLAS